MENIEENTTLSDFQKLLLNGPIITNEGFKEAIKTREQINKRLGDKSNIKWKNLAFMTHKKKH